MALKALATLVGIALLLAYLLPMAIKLKELSLAVVVGGGILLAMIDAWHSFRDED